MQYGLQMSDSLNCVSLAWKDEITVRLRGTCFRPDGPAATGLPGSAAAGAAGLAASAAGLGASAAGLGASAAGFAPASAGLAGAGVGAADGTQAEIAAPPAAIASPIRKRRLLAIRCPPPSVTEPLTLAARRSRRENRLPDRTR